MVKEFAHYFYFSINSINKNVSVSWCCGTKDNLIQIYLFQVILAKNSCTQCKSRYFETIFMVRCIHRTMGKCKPSLGNFEMKMPMMLWFFFQSKQSLCERYFSTSFNHPNIRQWVSWIHHPSVRYIFRDINASRDISKQFAWLDVSEFDSNLFVPSHFS